MEAELTPEEQHAVQEFFRWLFNDSNGHFALLIAMLTICGVAFLFHVPKADVAIGTLFGYVLAKLK